MTQFKHYRFTIAITASTLVVFFNPILTGWLQLEFAAVSNGQFWRVLTGHITHYDTPHLFWDLLMFGVLAGLCERAHPKIFPWLLGLSALSISAVVACTGTVVYRGLSGVDTALFVWIAADQIRSSLQSNDRLTASIWMLPIFGLVGKLIFETATGATLFAQSSSFNPLVESHLAGVVAGGLSFVVDYLFKFGVYPS